MKWLGLYYMAKQEIYTMEDLERDRKEKGSYTAIWKVFQSGWPQMNTEVFYKLQKEMIRERFGKER